MNVRFNRLKMVKIAGGCFLAMTIAEGLGLRYGASAGVIALLSIHDTKRETIRAMAKRLGAFGIALALAPSALGWRATRLWPSDCFCCSSPRCVRCCKSRKDCR